jgi:hypothetical protein
MITIITVYSQTTKTVTVNAKELIAYKWINYMHITYTLTVVFNEV